jgi:hypothetical protein
MCTPCTDVGYVHLDDSQRMPTSSRNTPAYRMMAAAGHGCGHCVQKLLELRVDVNAKSAKGYTAWDWAKGFNHTEMVEFLELRGGRASGNSVAGWKRYYT